MFRVKSRSQLTQQVVEYPHEMKREDALLLVHYFNTIYEKIGQFWIEPVITLETIDQYYLF